LASQPLAELSAVIPFSLAVRRSSLIDSY